MDYISRIKMSEDKVNTKDMREFRHDLLYILNLTHLIDSMYGRNDSETYHYLKRLRRIIDNFNEKYPKIHVGVNKTHLNISLKFYIEEKSTPEVFDTFENTLKNRVFGGKVFEFRNKSSHTYPSVVKDTLALQRNKNRNMVELIYSYETLHNPLCPEFQLLATYALPDYKRNLDIKEEMDSYFCFDFNPDDKGKGFMYVPKTFSGEAVY